ncbi:hypothetical protein BKA80DRAFT_282643 [Phyllosticta citrichinensis]
MRSWSRGYDTCLPFIDDGASKLPGFESQWTQRFARVASVRGRVMLFCALGVGGGALGRGRGPDRAVTPMHPPPGVVAAFAGERLFADSFLLVVLVEVGEGYPRAVPGISFLLLACYCTVCMPCSRRGRDSSTTCLPMVATADPGTRSSKR